MSEPSNGMLPKGYDRPAEPPPAWRRDLDAGLQDAASAYELARSQADRLSALWSSLKTTLVALNTIGVISGFKLPLIHLLLALDQRRLGKDEPLLVAAPRKGRPGGRSLLLVQATLALASRQLIGCGLRPSAADDEVAAYARRKGLTGHRGQAITRRTVERWRLDTGKHGDLETARWIVETLSASLRLSPETLATVRGLNRKQIDHIASITVLKKDLAPY